MGGRRWWGGGGYKNNWTIGKSGSFEENGACSSRSECVRNTRIRTVLKYEALAVQLKGGHKQCEMEDNGSLVERIMKVQVVGKRPRVPSKEEMVEW